MKNHNGPVRMQLWTQLPLEQADVVQPPGFNVSMVPHQLLRVNYKTPKIRNRWLCRKVHVDTRWHTAVDHNSRAKKKTRIDEA